MQYVPDFRLARPGSIDEIVALKARHTAARYVAGGTDLLPNTRRGLIDTDLMIDLTGCAQLTGIELVDGTYVIGAAVTLSQLAAHDGISRDYPAVAQAAGAVAGPTQRGMATVGGNLCLDTRCIFYNQSEWWRSSNDYCLKYRGEICHVVPSSKRCYAAYSGDLAAPLLVHDAAVELAGVDGRRRVAIDDLFADDGIDYLTLTSDELLVAVHLPAGTAAIDAQYRKLRVRNSIDFPLAGVAVGVRRSAGAVAALCAGLTGTNSRPLLVVAEAPTGDSLAARIRKAVSPVRTGLIQPQYRRRAIAALAGQMARDMCG